MTFSHDWNSCLCILYISLYHAFGPLHNISLLPESILQIFSPLLAPSNILVVGLVQGSGNTTRAAGLGSNLGFECVIDSRQHKNARYTFIDRTPFRHYSGPPRLSVGHQFHRCLVPTPRMPCCLPISSLRLDHYKCRRRHVSYSAVGMSVMCRRYGRICETNDINHVEHEGKDDNGNEAACQAC